MVRAITHTNLKKPGAPGHTHCTLHLCTASRGGRAQGRLIDGCQELAGAERRNACVVGMNSYCEVKKHVETR